MTKSTNDTINRVAEAAAHATDSAAKNAKSISAATVDAVGKKVDAAGKAANKSIKSGRKLADKASKKAGKTLDKANKASKKVVRSAAKKQGDNRGKIVLIVVLLVAIGAAFAVTSSKQNS